MYLKYIECGEKCRNSLYKHGQGSQHSHPSARVCREIIFTAANFYMRSHLAPLTGVEHFFLFSFFEGKIMLPGRSGCLYHTLLHIIFACGPISPMIELFSLGGPRFGMTGGGEKKQR